MKMKKIAALLAVAGFAAPAFATNGMNMEGYGPVATAMGGASMAYDNGNAGMINNPATLGFMQSGTSRFDMALGGLHPDVTANSQGSGATAFYMPAFGYVRKDGNLSWGVGMMAQGGMGTDYSNGSFYGTTSVATGALGAADLALGQSLRNMSEVGVGRVIFPLAYQVNDKLNLAVSIDYVWAGMDIKWLVDGAHFFDMMTGPTAVAFGAKQTFGKLTGSMHDFFDTQFGLGNLTDLGWGYWNFEKAGKFGQKATGSGLAGNLGFTYKVSQQLVIGGSYHAKTRLSDLDTGANGAVASFRVGTGGAFPVGATTVNVTGRVKVRNFQWPETYGIGASYQPNDRWTLVGDYKRINWAAVMKSFNMSFEAASDDGGFGLGGTVMNMDFYQNWKNQNVVQLGAAYRYTDSLTVRVGANISDNPVPNATVTALFPAIIKEQYTFGAGYRIDKVSSVDFSFAYAPKVTVTNSWSALPAGVGVNRTSNQAISMSQSNWQLMYSHRF